MKFSDSKATEKVYSEIEIKASNSKIWKMISEPGNLNLCHPFCKSNIVEKWNDVGAVDFIEYYNGLTMKRLFTSWTPKEGYELIIGKGNQGVAKVKWEIISKNKQSSSLKISITLLPEIILYKYPKLIHNILVLVYLKPKMKNYINAVVKGFKYHIETGIKVKKNQFGYNSMFSIK